MSQDKEARLAAMRPEILTGPRVLELTREQWSAQPFRDRVRVERDRQRALWGDSNDDEHTDQSWMAVVVSHVGKLATTLVVNPHDLTLLVRERLVKIAALCQAWDEAIARAEK